MSTGSSSQFDMNHWLLRFLAFVIDSIIIGIPAWIIYALVISPFLWPSTYLGYIYLYGGAPWWGSLLLLFVIGILQLFYFAILDTAWGATVGKRVLGLQVQMVNGSQVTFDKAFVRNISKIYGLFLLLDWILGIATTGSDQRQKYTDRIAGTTVVSVKQVFSSATPPPPPPPPPAS